MREEGENFGASVGGEWRDENCIFYFLGGIIDRWN